MFDVLGRGANGCRYAFRPWRETLVSASGGCSPAVAVRGAARPGVRRSRQARDFVHLDGEFLHTDCAVHRHAGAGSAGERWRRRSRWPSAGPPSYVLARGFRERPLPAPSGSEKSRRGTPGLWGARVTVAGRRLDPAEPNAIGPGAARRALATASCWTGGSTNQAVFLPWCAGKSGRPQPSTP